MTVMTNDALSRVTQSVDPKSLATNFSYDPAGNLGIELGNCTQAPPANTCPAKSSGSTK